MTADEMDIDTFIELETKVWEALRRGDAEADARLLAEDFVGLYSTGFANRSEHAGQLANGPTVADYELHEPRLIVLSENDVLFCYRADWHRFSTSERGPRESMYVSSLWSRRSGQWVNVFSQDTPARSGTTTVDDIDLARNKAVVREIDDLGNGVGDLDRLDALCTPGMQNHALASGGPPGVEGTREFLRRARRSQHPARWLASHVVAEGDFVVQFGTREHDWPGGTFRGFDAPPGTYQRETAFAYRFVDGRIAERWAIRDDLAMLLQLGAIHPGSA